MLKDKKQREGNNVIPLHEAPSIIKLKKEIENLKGLHKKTCEMAARSILHALDLKDHYTYGHSIRVAYYSLVLGRELGLNKNELYDLEMASLFHDIGKIGIPDSILLKSVRLKEEEFSIMMSHPVKSAKILEGFKDFEAIAKYAQHHHERFDGKGYPDGLKGEEIPFFSRIIFIADTFDAMTSTRPYRKGLSNKIAFRELRDFSGPQFDPKLVEVFIRAMDRSEIKKEKTFNLTILEGYFEKLAA